MKFHAITNSGRKSSARPINKLSNKIKNADEIVFISDNIRVKYDQGLSGYLRPQASDSVSTGNTSLRTSGNLNIANKAGKVKPSDVQVCMHRMIILLISFL